MDVVGYAVTQYSSRWMRECQPEQGLPLGKASIRYGRLRLTFDQTHVRPHRSRKTEGSHLIEIVEARIYVEQGGQIQGCIDQGRVGLKPVRGKREQSTCELY